MIETKKTSQQIKYILLLTNWSSGSFSENFLSGCKWNSQITQICSKFMLSLLRRAFCLKRLEVSTKWAAAPEGKLFRQQQAETFFLVDWKKGFSKTPALCIDKRILYVLLNPARFHSFSRLKIYVSDYTIEFTFFVLSSRLPAKKLLAQYFHERHFNRFVCLRKLILKLCWMLSQPRVSCARENILFLSESTRVSLLFAHQLHNPDLWCSRGYSAQKESLCLSRCPGKAFNKFSFSSTHSTLLIARSISRAKVFICLFCLWNYLFGVLRKTIPFGRVSFQLKWKIPNKGPKRVCEKLRFSTKRRVNTSCDSFSF